MMQSQENLNCSLYLCFQVEWIQRREHLKSASYAVVFRAERVRRLPRGSALWTRAQTALSGAALLPQGLRYTTLWSSRLPPHRWPWGLYRSQSTRSRKCGKRRNSLILINSCVVRIEYVLVGSRDDHAHGGEETGLSFLRSACHFTVPNASMSGSTPIHRINTHTYACVHMRQDVSEAKTKVIIASNIACRSGCISPSIAPYFIISFFSSVVVCGWVYALMLPSAYFSSFCTHEALI